MENMERIDSTFYKGKTVLVTGHTGFKGTWLCLFLIKLGAKVVGYSLEPSTTPNLFDLTNLGNKMTSIIGDIRDFEKLKNVFEKYQPELVFHLAAQPIVSESYLNPKYTYETNVLGTVNILECIRLTSSVKSFVNVTTDKVYKNEELSIPFNEEDPLDGIDPYSNSKSCSELVTHSYRRSFFQERDVSISTARAGNVIGGGDFSVNRILPDCYRAIAANSMLNIRHPESIRPYQFVLEPIFMYVLIAFKQYGDKRYEGEYNIGPDDVNSVNTITLVKIYQKFDASLTYQILENSKFHEASYLKLNNKKIKEIFGYKQIFDINKAVELSCFFYSNFKKLGAEKIINEQIDYIMKFVK